MMDLVFKKFEWTADPKDSIYPLFGFAIEDYITKYGVSSELLKDFWIFGAILDKSDNTDYFFRYMDYLRNAGNIRMFVFDINCISKDFIDKLKRQFIDGGAYDELENCYDDRIVFVLKEV